MCMRMHVNTTNNVWGRRIHGKCALSICDAHVFGFTVATPTQNTEIEDFMQRSLQVVQGLKQTFLTTDSQPRVIPDNQP